MPHAIAIVHVVDPWWVVWWSNNWGWIVLFLIISPPNYPRRPEERGQAGRVALYES